MKLESDDTSQSLNAPAQVGVACGNVDLLEIPGVTQYGTSPQALRSSVLVKLLEGTPETIRYYREGWQWAGKNDFLPNDQALLCQAEKVPQTQVSVAPWHADRPV